MIAPPEASNENTTLSFDESRIDRALPLAPQVYDLLRHRIVDNRLVPGARISESVMANQLDISRTPLRAALQQLANEGLVEIRPQVNSVVAGLDNARLEEAVFMRSALEEAVVRKLAAGAFDPTALEESFAAQERPAKTDDYATFFRADEAFHARLATLAGMPNVWKTVHSVKGHVDRQRYTLMSGIPFRSLRAYREHKDIVDLIVGGDGQGAARAMRQHVNSVLELDASGALGAGRHGKLSHNEKNTDTRRRNR